MFIIDGLLDSISFQMLHPVSRHKPVVGSKTLVLTKGLFFMRYIPFVENNVNIALFSLAY